MQGAAARAGQGGAVAWSDRAPNWFCLKWTS
jgi:hypothetical protein